MALATRPGTSASGMGRPRPRSRALVATGSPFEPVEVNGRSVRIGQGNNAVIFPGVGRGALLAEASRVTEPMFAAAAECLADQLRQEDVEAGSLYPPIGALRRVTGKIAEAVIRSARDLGLGRPIPDADVPGLVAGSMWEPRYLPLVPGRDSSPLREGPAEE